MASPQPSTSQVNEEEEEEDTDTEVQVAVSGSAPNTQDALRDLDGALVEAQSAIDHFFNNEFDMARDLMQPLAHVSMYHSVGNSVFAFLEALLTFEEEYIAKASKALKLCLSVCNRYRKKNTVTEAIGKPFKRPNYDAYTELEVHAELCAAEALLLKALITFIEDETLTSLIKGGMKIRTCFNMYKECNEILLNRKWPRRSRSKKHFESGVKMGLGAFHLMVSFLPAKVIKIMEFVGFSVDRETGLRDLEAGYRIQGIRQILCTMTLLAYHLIVSYVLSHQEGNLEFCDLILDEQLASYPDGVWFIFFKGRLEYMLGHLDNAIYWYKKSLRSQNIWVQFYHLCYWELLWINCIKLEWSEALEYSTYLAENSKWSRTIYSYQKAAIIFMMVDSGMKLPKNVDVETMKKLMRDVPQYKQRIAGKSLPMEKFTIKRAERFIAQNNFLVLPIIELLYLWNSFKLLKKDYLSAENIYKAIVRAQDRLKAKRNSGPFDIDNRALLSLLQGACLRQMNSPLLALSCLDSVVALHKQIKEDKFVIPYAVVEIGLLYMDQGKKDNAIAALSDAKRNYTGYWLESRLHFRIHTALTELKATSDTTAVVTQPGQPTTHPLQPIP